MLNIFKDNEILKKQISPLINLKNFPGNIRISTITITCRLDSYFYYANIGKYITLSLDSIISRKYGDDPSCGKSLIVQKKTRKRKKPKRVFFNQATLLIKADPFKTVNIKLFKNGSMQITGCRHFQDFINIITILCKELKVNKGIIDPKTMKKIIAKPFVSNCENICVSKIQNFSINMINSDFDAKMKIDRKKFYDLLIKQNVECRYEPNKHAAINIKYKYKYRYIAKIPQDMDSLNTKKVIEERDGIDTITILVFESGKIIITAAKKKDHIMKAYEFINNKIIENYDTIVKPDDSIVQKCIDDILKDIDIKDIVDDD